MAIQNFYQQTTVTFSVHCTSGGVPINISPDTVTLKLVRGTNLTTTPDFTKDADVTTRGASGYADFALTPTDTNLAPDIYYYEIILTRAGGEVYSLETGSFQIYERFPVDASSYITTGVDYLIPELRVHLGDTTAASYTYSEDLLRSALVMAVRALMRKWNSRYKIDNTGVVTRSTTLVYADVEPPVIMYADEYPILLQASIIVKSATLQGSAWDVASWKDDEISYSNISGAKLAEESIARDRAELDDIIRKRLYGVSKQSLTGFRYPPNYFEG